MRSSIDQGPAVGSAGGADGVKCFSVNLQTFGAGPSTTLTRAKCCRAR
jgi:hypothetical protein